MSIDRKIAVSALIRLERQNGYSNIMIDKAIRKAKLDAHQSAFASALFYGVLERMITLDHCIAAFSRLPLSKIDPDILWILRAGIYQILYLDGVPHSAAVDESVALAKAFRKTSAAGFVNALLRSFLRAGGNIPPVQGSESEQWSVRYSCPTWLCELWIKAYGMQKAQELLHRSLGPAPLYLRVNPLRTTAQTLFHHLIEAGFAAQMVDTVENCLLLHSPGDIRSIPGYEEGFFHIQDLSSQICAEALNAKPGERIADFCAAPGGKSVTIAQNMQNAGEVWSFDLHAGKLALIRETADRLGIKNLKAMQNDASIYRPELGVFDRVLCDVPCSGLGIIRRKPEIKYKQPSLLEKLPQVQYKILETSAQYLKEGGTLVYSTCALDPAENDAVVDRFLVTHTKFHPKEILFYHGKKDSRVTLPEDGLDCDGFFIAVMQKEG